MFFLTHGFIYIYIDNEIAQRGLPAFAGSGIDSAHNALAASIWLPRRPGRLGLAASPWPPRPGRIALATSPCSHRPGRIALAVSALAAVVCHDCPNA